VDSSAGKRFIYYPDTHQIPKENFEKNSHRAGGLAELESITWRFDQIVVVILWIQFPAFSSMTGRVVFQNANDVKELLV